MNKREGVSCQVDAKLETRFQADPRFILREIADEAVLVPVGDCGPLTNSMLSLNETCLFLWKLFETPAAVSDVIARAKEVYNDPTGRMDEEIRQFVAEYAKYGLLREV